jgi:chromosome segregation ATPase
MEAIVIFLILSTIANWRFIFKLHRKVLIMDEQQNEIQEQIDAIAANLLEASDDITSLTDEVASLKEQLANLQSDDGKIAINEVLSMLAPLAEQSAALAAKYTPPSE